MAQQNGDIRLVGGTAENNGRVEVYYNKTWGTVCDDSWQLLDGDVVCKQLGFQRSDRVVYNAYFGRGTGQIWIDQLNCQGTEASINECRHNGWGIHDCEHKEDAGVFCLRKDPVKPSSMPIRLSCPRYTTGGTCNACPSQPDPDNCTSQVAVEGIVEALYKNQWAPVSAEGWDENNARVACGELGYPVSFGSGPSLDTLWPNWNGTQYSSCGDGSGQVTCDAFAIVENNAFRTRLRSTLLKKVDCTGAEYRLLNCYFPEFGPHSNPSMRVATVRCGFLAHSSCYGASVEVSTCMSIYETFLQLKFIGNINDNECMYETLKNRHDGNKPQYF